MCAAYSYIGAAIVFMVMVLKSLFANFLGCCCYRCIDLPAADPALTRCRFDPDSFYFTVSLSIDTRFIVDSDIAMFHCRSQLVDSSSQAKP